MNKTLKLILPALLIAGLCLPALAQDEETAPAGDAAAAAAPAEKPAPTPAPKKPAKKKPAKKKKKPAKPVSEYKFTSEEAAQPYKFDKKANPIIKEKKKKKAAKKGTAPAAKSGTTPAGKLKPAKSIGAEEEAKDAAAQGGQ